MTGNLEFVSSDQTKPIRRCFLGQRHIVATIGFLNAFLIMSNRLVLGVSIVAMVNHRKENETSKWGAGEISCPLPTDTSKLVVESNEFQGEFDWSTELQGYLLGAGFLSFLTTQIPAGGLADSVGSKALLVYSNAASGILTLISPFAARCHVYALMVVQLLRGASQGITTPAIFRMLSNWIPRNERGTLNTLVVCGYSVGIAVSGIVTGWLCDIPGLGWPSAFYIWGTISIVVAVTTQFIYYEYPTGNPWIKDEELKYITDGLETKGSTKPRPTPWKKIFTSLPSYAYCYGLFGNYWALSYFMTVHPTFMGTVLHYSMAENGLTSCLPALMQTVGGIIASMVCYWITKKNWVSLNTLRKTTSALSAFGFSLCMAGILLAGCDVIINILCFALSLFSLGIGLSGIVIAVIDMAPAFTGSVMGVASTLGGTSSVFVPVITGLLTTHNTLSEWQMIFWINLVVAGSGGIVFIVFGSAEVQPWNYPDGVAAEVSPEERSPEDKSNNHTMETKMF